MDEPADVRDVLARLLFARDSAHARSSGPLTDDFWTLLRSAAISERVVPALARGVADGRLVASRQQAEDAESLWLEVMRRCLRLEGRLLWLVDHLADRGIEIRVLKGPASAHLDHLRPEDRQFGDLDVLVRGNDMPAVFEVLARDGFRRRFPEPRPGFDRRFTKSVSFAGDVEVDVHRTIAEGPIGHRIPVVDLWCRSAPFEVGRVEVHALDHTERFVHACLHTVLAPPPVRLSSLSDVMRGLVGGHADPGRVVELSRRWGVAAVVDRAITAAVTEIWWPLELDGRWRSATPVGLVQSMMIESHRRNETSSAARAVLSLATLPTLRDRIAYAAALAAPASPYVDARHAGRAARFRHAYRQLVDVVRSVGGDGRGG